MKKGMAIALSTALALLVVGGAVYFNLAADSNDGDAEFATAEEYRLGENREQSYELAADWYRRAAEQGHAAAQETLAQMYFTGQGVSKSEAKELEWRRKAAHNGHPLAQFNLGSMYFEGEGVPENQNEAVKWWRKAANQGQPEAQLKLGAAYALGKSVEEDLRVAYKWIYLASLHDTDGAQETLELVEQLMDPGKAEAILAKIDALEWLEKWRDDGAGGSQNAMEKPDTDERPVSDSREPSRDQYQAAPAASMSHEDQQRCLIFVNMQLQMATANSRIFGENYAVQQFMENVLEDQGQECIDYAQQQGIFR